MKNSKMVQYSVWHNCNNNCKFCLIDNKTFLNKQKQLNSLNSIIENIDHVDWINEFNRGVSLLGGELYYITDKDLQDTFIKLLDVIVDKVILPNQKMGNYYCKYSTVTNGIYSPEFLFFCMDRLIDKIGLQGIDINFSYDIKYRYKNEDDHQKVLSNIKEFQLRYPDYKLGVQSICTQYLIDEILNNNFLQKWYQKNPNTSIGLLYPHPPHTGFIMDDFLPKRESMFELVEYLLKNGFGDELEHFKGSVANSSVFKHTGLYYKEDDWGNEFIDTKQKPILSQDKTSKNKQCGHSKLYQCYSNSDKCLLCDLNNLLGD